MTQLGRYAVLTLVITGVTALAACSRSLDTDALEVEIKAGIEKQGGVFVKAITCPTNLKPAKELTFECVGELEPTGNFWVTVKRNEQAVQWEIPHSKGLLNLDKLEALFQDTLQKEIGTPPKIDCGPAYRLNRPGDLFECKIAPVAIAPSPKASAEQPNANPEKTRQAKSQPEAIVVRTDLEGNITWQQVLAANTVLAKSTTDSSTTVAQAIAPSNPAPDEPESASVDQQTTPSTPVAQPETSAAPASPAAQSAEDFLNSPGALEDFD